jgi:hypothetical protein
LPQLTHNRLMPVEESLQTVAFVAKSLSDENRRRILLCVLKSRLAVSPDPTYKLDYYYRQL